MRIQRGDTVLVIAGKEKGKTGKVERSLVEQEKVIVEGLNLVTKHSKPRPGVRQTGGKIQKESPIHVSNVRVVCNKCSKPMRPTRLLLESGARVRACSKCKEVIDDAGQG